MTQYKTKRVAVLMRIYPDNSVRFGIEGSVKEGDPIGDLKVLLEGVALLTHIVGKYKEHQNPRQTQKETVTYLSEAFQRHTAFSFDNKDDDLHKPSQ